MKRRPEGALYTRIIFTWMIVLSSYGLSFGQDQQDHQTNRQLGTSTSPLGNSTSQIDANPGVKRAQEARALSLASDERVKQGLNPYQRPAGLLTAPGVLTQPGYKKSLFPTTNG